MYCLTNMCYVCLEKNDKSLVNINSSSMNKDIIHIISNLPFNLAWLKTKQIILICEECCLRLRGTYKFLAMCLKNSSLMQGYMDKINTASISNENNEAVLRVDLNNIQNNININEIKCEIKLENEEIYTFEKEPIIEETRNLFVNVDDSFVKEEDTWEREEVDVKEEPLMDNNFTENNDNETDSEICVNSNTHDTGNVVIEQKVILIPEYKTSTAVGTIGEQNLPYQCKVCSTAFSTKEQLNYHTIHAEHLTKRFCKYCRQSVDIAEFDTHIKQHKNEQVFCCEYCGEMIYELNTFIRHSRTHRPHKCPLCPMQFDAKILLTRHLKVHTGTIRDQCKYCNRKFGRPSALINHLASRTCQKDKIRYQCTICNITYTSEKYCKNHQKLVHQI